MRLKDIIKPFEIGFTGVLFVIATLSFFLALFVVSYSPEHMRENMISVEVLFFIIYTGWAILSFASWLIFKILDLTFGKDW